MKTFILGSLLLSSMAVASVDGLTIPNSHQVDRSGNVFRGKEPGRLVSELAHIGITDVIIFKTETRDEVRKEIAELNRLRIRSHHIPFGWKDFPSMQVACEQTVDALNLITKVKYVNGKVFFHCTAGEDRTGMLAGLYRMLEDRISPQEAFRTEMCPRGYSDGNPKKPYNVTSAIQKELTPLFIALTEKIQRGEWKLGKIPRSSCAKLNLRSTSLKCR